MSDKTIIALIETTLDEKIEKNEDFIRYSYYEVNVKYDNILLKECKDRFFKHIIIEENKKIQGKGEER